MDSIGNNINLVTERIARAAERAGRRADDVSLVAVSKTRPTDAVRRAYERGIRHFGENRIEEAIPKMDALKTLDINWHMVGQLQTRKAKDAAGNFFLIHSLDREKLARSLEKSASEKGIEKADALIQIDFTNTPGRGGIAEDSLLSFIETMEKFPHLAVVGLMTIPPYHPDAEESRPYFRRLRKIFEKISEANFSRVKMRCLSMGMTDDFEVAIEEGSNMVRIGRAIFGEMQ